MLSLHVLARLLLFLPLMQCVEALLLLDRLSYLQEKVIAGHVFMCNCVYLLIHGVNNLWKLCSPVL